MKRVRVNSHDSTVRCFFKYPAMDPNKKYEVTIEKLCVPSVYSNLLNGELFTIERRVEGASEMIPIPTYGTFIARNVQTVSQLVWQMNDFFRESIRKSITAELEQKEDEYAEVPDDLLSDGTPDWNALDDEVDKHLFVVFRTDGRIAFQFSASAQKIYVLKLTERGQMIFGHSTRYIAAQNVNQQLTFDQYDIVINRFPDNPLQNDFVDPVLDDIVTFPDSVQYIAPNNLFTHLKYRHAIVLNSNLPTENKAVATGSKTYRHKELASYEFMDTNVHVSQHGTNRYIEEDMTAIHFYETSDATHNKLIMSHTDFQNFHVRLQERYYEKQDNNYVEKIRPLQMSPGTFWSVQFLIVAL